MALVMEANYSKKLGLPGYSSHQYSVTVRTELADISHVQNESTRLYTLLQSSVDREIQKSGFLPMNGKVNGSAQATTNGHGEAWNCSPKQKELIQRILNENKIDKNRVEQLARDRFGKAVQSLDKLEASWLIDELLEQNGNRPRLQRAGGR
jgi:hypothetical protein